MAVEKTAYSYDVLYSYLVPNDLIKHAIKGCRVVVPFGRNNKRIQGLIFNVKPFSQNDIKTPLKSIISVIDSTPYINEKMFNIIQYLVSNTFCTYYDAIKTVLPLGLSVNIIIKYRIKENINIKEFNALERALLEYLLESNEKKQIDRLTEYINNPEKKSIVLNLIKKGILIEENTLEKRVKDKTIKMVAINKEFDFNLKLSSKQQAVIDFLNSVETAAIKEVTYYCGVSQAVVKALIDKGIIIKKDYPVIEKEQNYNHTKPMKLTLSNEQENVFNGLNVLLKQDKPNVALLHGVTGSGKTQVFIAIIKEAIANDKNVIMLVPEIALTPQMIDIFTNHFPNQIAITHSGLSIAKRLEQWEMIKKQKVKIVIGTRSAIFAPFDNVSLIVMDEEGENSYKSESTPNYHAREVAKLRVVQNNGLLILASATPSLESYYNAVNKKYHLFELNNRYSDISLPQVSIIDMSKEDTSNTSIFSKTLQSEIQKNLDSNEQSIILLNRRGYNTYLVCMSCNEILSCPHCDIALTYHKPNNLLMCHYCGYSSDDKSKCFKCGSTHLKFMGEGTQKLEYELNILFPDAKVLRMDADTIYDKNTYENNFSDFRKHKYDILIGTQMISKGLDFANVTLVGIINADKGLFSQDYNSCVRVFSMITQAIGRSGRSEKLGRAFIQTDFPNDPVIKFASMQDYKGFYEYEIEYRKNMLYPPFCDICSVMVISENEENAENTAKLFISYLLEVVKNSDKKIPIRVLGPAMATIYKVNNKYRYRIIIKCKNNKAFRDIVSQTLGHVNKITKNVILLPNINGELF